MLHSVWDWNKVRYDYYKSDLPASIGGWNPLTGLGIPSKFNKTGSPIGIDIEDALPELPESAVHTGSGPQAIGQVCRRRRGNALAISGLGATSDNPHFTPNEVGAFLAGLALGSFVWKHRTLSVLALGMSALMVGVAAGQNGNGNDSAPK